MSVDFTYERFVQVESVDQGAPHRLAPVDALMEDHCRRALGHQGKRNLRLFVWQLKSLLPSVTIVLIDDREVIVCLPWISSDSVQPRLHELGKAFFFTDRGANIAPEMNAMFDQLRTLATSVNEVASPRK